MSVSSMMNDRQDYQVKEYSCILHSHIHHHALPWERMKKETILLDGRPLTIITHTHSSSPLPLHVRTRHIHRLYSIPFIFLPLNTPSYLESYFPNLSLLALCFRSHELVVSQGVTNSIWCNLNARFQVNTLSSNSHHSLCFLACVIWGWVPIS